MGMKDTGFKVGATVEYQDGTWEAGAPFTAALLEAIDEISTLTIQTVAAPSEGQLSDFGFDVPQFVAINGIEIKAVGRSDGFAGKHANVEFELSWDDGAHWTDAHTKNAIFDVGDYQTKYAGGSSDPWGRTWSPSDFNDGNLRLKCLGWEDQGGGSGSYAYFDYFAIKVYYTHNFKARAVMCD